MKKIILASILMLAGLIQAQEFQGMAVYESKTSTADITKSFSGNRDITPEMQKQIEERMRKMIEKTFAHDIPIINIRNKRPQRLCTNINKTKAPIARISEDLKK